MIFCFSAVPAMAAAAKKKPKKPTQIVAVADKPKKKKSAKKDEKKKMVAEVKTEKLPEKKIMVVSLEPVKRKAPQAPPPTTVNKEGKSLVEVSFGGQTSESDLEPLARSARQAEKEAKRKKTMSEAENKFEARTATDKKQGIEVKSDADEVISAPEAPTPNEDSRSLASSAAKKNVPEKPINELYRDFQKQVENEVDEDYN
jgi:hypothetical protein